MPEVSCTMRLLEDADIQFVTRTCTIALLGERQAGTWSLVDESADPRIKLAVASGGWSMNEVEYGGPWSMYIFDGNWRILLELNGLSGNFLDYVVAGYPVSGEGSHLGPPRTDIMYQIWLGYA